MEYRQDLRHRIRVAMGQESADLLLINGRVVSTFTEEILEVPIAIANGRIVSLGEVGEAKETVDLEGAYVAPGFIDPHIHVESSMLSPEGFAEAVVPRGTCATVSDPHEIVNVLGMTGFRYMVKASQGLPMEICYTIPSCVPATHMETAGGKIDAQDIAQAFECNPRTVALSEMMNYPGVYFADDGVLDKICAAKSLQLPIDGHCPMLRGKELNAYINAGISTEHECTSAEEAREKLRKGMYVFMREGSAAKNLADLLPVLSDHNVHRICIACDDRHPDDLVANGHLDAVLRKLVALGVDPVRAIRILSLNPAMLYRLQDLGGIGIGYQANLVILDNLQNLRVEQVYYRGKKVAEHGRLITPLERKDASETFSSVRLPRAFAEKLQKFPNKGKIRVIGILEGQLITENLEGNAEEVENGELAYLAVVERYGKNGQVGVGFAKGMGLQKGALASTVAHDNHNLILLGKSIADMETAAKAVEKIQGGFAVVADGQVLASLALPVGGLMSLENIETVASSLEHLEQQARLLGVVPRSPFMVLSFLALAVIPHLKLTDQGLVDVDQFALVPLEI